jgi:hypothetical protein
VEKDEDEGEEMWKVTRMKERKQVVAVGRQMPV